MMSVYYSKVKNDLEILSVGNIDGTIQPTEPVAFKDKNIVKEINTSRESISPPFVWLSSKELPFSLERIKIKQLNAFSELEKTILVLVYKSKYDNFNDLYFLYFNENFNHFGISHSRKNVTQENKQIIGLLLYNFIKDLIERQENDIEALKLYNKSVDVLVNKIKSSKTTMKAKEEEHKRIIHNLITDIANELTQSFNHKKIQFTDPALKLIYEYSGKITELKKVIRNAVFFANNQKFGQFNNIIIIEDYHLDFLSYETAQNKSIAPSSAIASRDAKAIALLDNLENAAQKVIQAQLKLTSINVGNACIRHMSPPGIRDALKNYSRNIGILLNKYPGKWPIIRHDFRPVYNIIVDQKDKDLEEDQA